MFETTFTEEDLEKYSFEDFTEDPAGSQNYRNAMVRYQKNVRTYSERIRYIQRVRLEVGKSYKGRVVLNGTGLSIPSTPLEVIQEYDTYYLLHTGEYYVCIHKMSSEYVFQEVYNEESGHKED